MSETVSFNAHSALLQDGAMQMLRVVDEDGPVGFATALTLLHDDEAFREFFIALLRDAPFGAYRFETPALTFASADEPFEFVLVRDASLDRPASPSAFAEHFAASDGDAPCVGFANLGQDAFLVVPTPLADASVYAHLGAFVRGAPPSQVHALWQRAARAATLRINERPVWLNTAGGGVPWLHVRLDTRPKYYVFKPYARSRQTGRQ